MSHSLALLAQTSVIAFVVLSMLSAGLTLSIRQVSEPFRSPRLVISALAANFVLVPLSAYLITRTIPLDPPLVFALLLLGTAGGAPMLPKLVEFARGNLALAVGLVPLLMTGTIVTMPLVLPMLLPGVHANAWSIAKPLLSVVLPSIALGLCVPAYSKALAARLQPIFRVASNAALAVVILVALANSFSPLARSVSLKAIVAGAFLFVIWFGIGFALGGPDDDTRRVLALATTVRGASIALLVAVENFHDSSIVNLLAILALVALTIQIPAAFAMGIRIKRQVDLA